MITRKLLAVTVLLVGICLAMANTALALGDTCSNVDITLTNATAVKIKVTKFEYYDYSDKKWRTESMFGLDGHKKLGLGESWSKTQDLEHIENDNTKFKVTYEGDTDATKSGDPVSKTTSDFICKDKMKKAVILDVALPITTGISPSRSSDIKDCTSQETTEIGLAIDFGSTEWNEFEAVLEDIRDWSVTIGNCLENRFKKSGKVVCEKSMKGSCTSKDGTNNGFASPFNEKCHMCPDFLTKIRAISGKTNRQACYFALVTHEWGHTCERGHKTLEIIDDEAFNFWKSKHSDVTISFSECGMR